jgi:hypothetical protein
MRLPCRQIAGVVFVGMLAASAQRVDAQLWRHFLPTSKSANNAEAAREADLQALRAARAGSIDGHSSAAALADQGPAPIGGDLALTQNNGPWLIVAASFSGPGAEKQARDLADELRGQYRLATYIHEMDFKFGDDNPGRGLDNYGAPTRRHYRRGNGAREMAVMVGDFTSIDDPNAQQMLNQIKALQPNALNVDPNESSQTMAQVRHFEDVYKENFGKGGSKRRGPMAQAFLTRNPLLPREYFVPKGVDPFVAKMNEGVDHSLLDCPGQQTIRVATFRGKTILQTSATPTQTGKSFWGGKRKVDSNPLVEAAENAHLLTKELRDHGWEAYEFHDRMESIVTIGSFADVTQRLPDGRVVVIPEVQKIIQTFDAGFDTPADPLSGIGNDSTNQRLVDQEEQQLSMQLSNKQGHVVAGLNPKHVKILRGRGKSLKVDRIIPIDVHPEAIDVPKRNVSSAYAG